MGVPRHPLLASWGRDAREMQLVLGGSGPGEVGEETAAPAAPHCCSESRRTSGSTALRSTGASGLSCDADDDSIRVHSCHGRGRQVEVLRDAVLHLLEDDPTLEPRDIIVLCPDIENFAPLIQATFGTRDLNDRVRRSSTGRSRSAWPTGRYARPTRSWASSPRSSTLPRLG